MKCTWPTRKFCNQSNLNSIGLRWGFALGVTQILCFALGVMQILVFLDTNMLVYPTQNFVLGLKPAQGPNASVFASQWNIGTQRGHPGPLWGKQVTLT